MTGQRPGHQAQIRGHHPHPLQRNCEAPSPGAAPWEMGPGTLPRAWSEASIAPNPWLSPRFSVILTLLTSLPLAGAAPPALLFCTLAPHTRAISPSCSFLAQHRRPPSASWTLVGGFSSHEPLLTKIPSNHTLLP